MRTILTLLLLASASLASEYEREIKPIFQRHCYSCHGPLKQRGKLRFDSIRVIQSAKDRITKAISGQKGIRQMPPRGEPLSKKEIATLLAWIKAGAHGPDDEVVIKDPRQHWSYQPPKKTSIPIVKSEWIRNPIDAFVLARQQKQKLKHAAPATKSTLLRRAYLDLIGVPPTHEQLHAFLKDPRPDAYERVVDRLLASPMYGERWGRHWMDIWRYSDWYGRRGQKEIRYSQYHIWRWRDWIIESVNEDKGYDRMILEMLAGDEIAPSDPKTLRATGFLGRNWYKFDRNVWMRETIEHTSLAFLALTLKCARCHDHKYDPILQKDYYRFRAFFEPHGVRLDPVRSGVDPMKDGLARVYDVNASAPTYLFHRGDDRSPDKSNPLTAQVPEALGKLDGKIQSVHLPPEAWYPALSSRAINQAKQELKNQINAIDQSIARLKTKKNEPEKKVISFLADSFDKPRPDLWKFGPGKWKLDNGRLREELVTTFAMATSTKNHPKDFRARIRYVTLPAGIYHSVGVSFDVVGSESFQAVYTSTKGGTVQAFHRQNRKEVYPPAGIVKCPTVKVNQELTLDLAVRGSLLNVWVNGALKIVYRMPMSRRAGRFALWVHSGKAEFLDVQLDPLPIETTMANSIQEKIQSPFLPQSKNAIPRLTQQREIAQFELQALEARIAAEKARHQSPPQKNWKELAVVAFQAEQYVKLLRAKSQGRSRKQIASLEAKLKQKSVAYTPLGKQAYPKTSTGRRLALARWIVDRKNPRTSRVAVNHIWNRHFGRGLVSSVANFGLVGKAPSHPQLLDWLAVRFAEKNWSMKWLHRLIVTSSTYRQASTNPSNEDAENRFLTRMNRKRMEAEVVRDSLLHLGEGIDTAKTGPELSQNQGQTSRRRSLYFRITPDDKMLMLELFDLANPNECYERKESVVPQQALALMNSDIALTQSRLLARRLAKKGGDFIDLAFQQVLSRKPTSSEHQRCQQFLREQTSILKKRGLTPFPSRSGSVIAPSADPTMRARENLIHVLFNHNDFVTIH